MDEIKLENRLTSLEQSQQYMAEEIIDIKDTQDEIRDLAMSVNSLAGAVKRLAEDTCKLAGRLDVMERKPGQRWESLISTLITAAATGAVGFMAAKLFGG